MKDPREVIIRPVITEHSYDQMEGNTFTFEVAKDANKVEIRQAIEAHLRCDGGQGEHAQREAEAEARSLPAGQDPHLEEGHGHAQGRRHHRAVRVSDVSTCCLGAPAIAGAPFLLEEGAKSELRAPSLTCRIALESLLHHADAADALDGAQALDGVIGMPRSAGVQVEHRVGVLAAGLVHHVLDVHAGHRRTRS